MAYGLPVAGSAPERSCVPDMTHSMKYPASDCTAPARVNVKSDENPVSASRTKPAISARPAIRFASVVSSLSTVVREVRRDGLGVVTGPGVYVSGDVKGHRALLRFVESAFNQRRADRKGVN